MVARVLVTGTGGLLGHATAAHLSRAGYEVLALENRAEIDLADASALEQRLRASHFEFAVHAAAMTAVDRAEREPSTAWAANTLATRNVARACATRGARLVYVSTASVFSAMERPAHEDDVPRPTNYYSWTKLLGEEAVLATGGVVLRATIIGARKDRPARNFVEWLTERFSTNADLTLYTDVRMNPLSHLTAARVCEQLLRAPAGSVWHAGTTDVCSKADVGRWVQATHFPTYSGRMTLAPAPRQEGTAARPLDMLLDVSKIESLLPMPTVAGELRNLFGEHQ